MEVKNKICPNLVGVDIGCGMHVVKLSVKKEDVDFEKLDKVIRECIPSGFNIRDDVHPYYKNVRVNDLDCYHAVDISRAARSIGTLGGGNHFIEIDEDDEGYLYLVVHSGSRHLGVEVANYYQEWGYNSAVQNYKNNRQYVIDKLRSEGREKEITSELAKIKFDVTKDLCWVGGLLFHLYLHDMMITQEYALWNRLAIVDTIIEHMGWGWNKLDEFRTIHNYIDIDNMILRKGAVSAYRGEILLIPMNMRDGSLICVGKANPDWNCSAPHGAGRLMSRAEAKKKIDISEFSDSMKGIYTTSVNEDTLDECPMAYKPMESIIENIQDTVDILKVIKPVYNFKASEKKKKRE